MQKPGAHMARVIREIDQDGATTLQFTEEKKRPFNVQEDLTYNRREVLNYSNNGIKKGIHYQ